MAGKGKRFSPRHRPIFCYMSHRQYIKETEGGGRGVPITRDVVVNTSWVFYIFRVALVHVVLQFFLLILVLNSFCCGK